MSPLTMDFCQGNQRENKGKVREIRILKLVATLVMINKSKLRGTKIYIENDLSFEERRKQKEIKKWAFEIKTKGWNVKIGTGRVCVEEQWIK